MAREYKLSVDQARREPSPGRPGLVNCAKSERNRIIKESKAAFLAQIYDPCPVVGVRVYKNDVVIVRQARDPESLADRLEGAERGKIERLSSRSRRNLAFVAANTERNLRSFITLTYPADYPSDGRKVKKHLHAFLAALRRFQGKIDYLWFLEFQARGAPHFHIFTSLAIPEPLTVLRRSLRSRDAEVHAPWQDWASEAWFRIVGSQDHRHLLAGTCWEKLRKADGAARYVAKEAYKTIQKDVPENYQDVGRFWGTSRGFRPDEAPLQRAPLSKLVRVFGDRLTGETGRVFPTLWNASDCLDGGLIPGD